MAINPIAGSALQGIHRAFQGLKRNASSIAAEVAKPEEPAATTDFNRSVVEMKQHETQAKASAKALQAYSDTLGTLLDIRA